jgi:hypothetical protein
VIQAWVFFYSGIDKLLNFWFHESVMAIDIQEILNGNPLASNQQMISVTAMTPSMPEASGVPTKNQTNDATRSIWRTIR